MLILIFLNANIIVLMKKSLLTLHSFAKLMENTAEQHWKDVENMWSQNFPCTYDWLSDFYVTQSQWYSTFNYITPYWKVGAKTKSKTSWNLSTDDKSQQHFIVLCENYVASNSPS